MKTKITGQTIVGIVSTGMLIIASVAPNTLHIPIPMRPWIFMLFIAWTILVASGIFSS